MWWSTCAALALTLSIHWLFARIGNSLSLVFRFLCVGVPIGLLHACLSVWWFGFGDTAISAVLMYACACELYIFLFTLAANGVSVSILDKLAAGATDLR